MYWENLHYELLNFYVKCVKTGLYKFFLRNKIHRYLFWRCMFCIQNLRKTNIKIGKKINNKIQAFEEDWMSLINKFPSEMYLLYHIWGIFLKANLILAVYWQSFFTSPCSFEFLEECPKFTSENTKNWKDKNVSHSHKKFQFSSRKYFILKRNS